MSADQTPPARMGQVVFRDGGGRVDRAAGTRWTPDGTKLPPLSAALLLCFEQLVVRRLEGSDPLMPEDLALSRGSAGRRLRRLNDALRPVTDGQLAAVGGATRGWVLAEGFDIVGAPPPCVHESVVAVVISAPWEAALGEDGVLLARTLALLPQGATLNADGLIEVAGWLGVDVRREAVAPLVTAAPSWTERERDALRREAASVPLARTALSSWLALGTLSRPTRSALTIAMLQEDATLATSLPALLAQAGHGPMLLDVMESLAADADDSNAPALAAACGSAAEAVGVTSAAERLATLAALGLAGDPPQGRKRLGGLAESGSALAAFLLGAVHLVADPDGGEAGRAALAQARKLAAQAGDVDLADTADAALRVLALGEASQAELSASEEAQVRAAEPNVRELLEPCGGGLWGLFQALFAAAALAHGSDRWRGRILRQLDPDKDTHPALSGLLAARSLVANWDGVSVDMVVGLPPLRRALWSLVERAPPLHNSAAEAHKALALAANRESADPIAVLTLAEQLSPVQVGPFRLLAPDGGEAARLLQRCLPALEAWPSAAHHYRALLGAVLLDANNDRAAGLAHLQAAASAGHPTGLHLLGRMLLQGRSLPKAEEAALSLLDRAADAGSSPARSAAAGHRVLHGTRKQRDDSLRVLVGMAEDLDVLAGLQLRVLLCADALMKASREGLFRAKQQASAAQACGRFVGPATEALRRLPADHPHRPALEILAAQSAGAPCSDATIAWLEDLAGQGALWASGLLGLDRALNRSS